MNLCFLRRIAAGYSCADRPAAELRGGQVGPQCWGRGAWRAWRSLEQRSRLARLAIGCCGVKRVLQLLRFPLASPPGTLSARSKSDGGACMPCLYLSLSLDWGEGQEVAARCVWVCSPSPVQSPSLGRSHQSKLCLINECGSQARLLSPALEGAWRALRSRRMINHTGNPRPALCGVSQSPHCSN